MKSSDSNDKYLDLSQISESIALFTQNCTISTDYIINNSKNKTTFISSLLGNDV